ncbi:hypothetical protein VPH70E345_0092 [Vibrio phage 70E34-5]|nr:hypothetical protein SIPHO082v1_p0090 [Vibrio phage 294E48.1]
MIDRVFTFRNGLVKIDPEDNNKLGLWHKVIYEQCDNCGKNAEMDILAAGPNVSVLEYACGCIRRCEGSEVTWSTSNKQSS